MRLTNSIKDLIIQNIMDDVPTPVTQSTIQDAVLREVNNLLPPAIQACMRNPELKTFLERRCVCIYGRHLDYLTYTSVYTFGSEAVASIVKEMPSLKALGNEYARLEYDRINLKRGLIKMMTAFSTTRQVVEACPELSKYVPTEPAKSSRLVPASISEPVISALTAAGWPKDKVVPIEPKAKPITKKAKV